MKLVERSGIKHELPAAEVPAEAGDPATYAALQHHIDTQGYYLGRAQGAQVSREAAGVHWYETLYWPMITAIRHWGIRSAFRGRTESVLYLRMMDHRHYLTEQTCQDPGPDGALVDYIRRMGSRRARRQVTRHQASTHGQADGTATQVVSAVDGGSSQRWRWWELPVRLVRALWKRVPGSSRSDT